MPCVPFTSNGMTGIACYSRGPRKLCACGKPAPLLCDWKVPTKRSGTCDRPICTTCSHKPAAGKDLCPEHAAEWRARQHTNTIGGQST